MKLFHKKTLGEGFFIKPLNNIFNSPIEDGKLNMIFDTKHAYYFSIGNINILMHIGLDTVKLKGKPFNVQARVNQKVNLNSKIVEVDLNMIKKHNLLIETPIVFETSEKLNFQLLKTGTVKQGEIIGKILINKEKLDENEILPVSFLGKYENIAKKINELVGTNLNYTKMYNCMTRLRFSITDKTKVQESEIKKIKMVKGINWTGNELQIIIGGEVYRVREALSNLLANKNNKIIKTKKTFKQDFFAFITNVVIPILPILIGVGMLKALQSILQIFGAIPTIPNNTTGSNLVDNSGWFAVLLYIISEVGLGFLGVFFCYSTVRYLGGNTYIGLLIGLTLASPFLFPGSKIVFFELGSIDVGIRTYTNSVIPQVGAAFLYVGLDNWCKKWVPKNVDIIFRHFIAITGTTFLTFLLIGPALGIIEIGIGYIISGIGKIPFGIGVGIYSFTRQMFVITGLHSAITAIIGIPWYAGESLTLMLAVPLAVYGQLGAGLGVASRTKNANIRAASTAATPAAIFGITEPIIYGVNLPKLRPFLMGCIGAGVGGIIVGIFEVSCYNGMGQGVFAITGVIPGGTKDIIIFSIASIVTLAISFGLTFLFYKERANEFKETKRLNKILLKVIKENNIDYNLEQQIEKLCFELENNFDKEAKEKILELDKLINIKTKLLIKQQRIQSKEDLNKEKYALLANKAYEKENYIKVQVYNNKFNSINYQESIKEIELKIYELDKNLNEKLKWFEKFSKKYLDAVTKIIDNLNDIELIEKNSFQSAYYNAINSVNISYQIIEPKAVKNLIRKEKKHEKINISR